MEGKKVARLFKTKGKDGKVYLSGAMTSMTRLVIVENDRKTDPRQPDYYAYIVPNRGPRPIEEEFEDD